jgi:biotin carboxyl carrier protein
MKFEAKIQSGDKSSEHALELNAADTTMGEMGVTPILVDGEPARVDWAMIESDRYSILLGESSYKARIWKVTAPSDGISVYQVAVGMHVARVELRDPRGRRRKFASALGNGPEDVLAPMPGRIVKVLAREGITVAPGQGLLVIEAMKMQNEVRATRAGCVERIYVREGEGVEAGSRLARLA